MTGKGLTRRRVVAGVAASLVARPAWSETAHLLQVARSKGIILGTAVEPGYLEDKAYARLVTDSCDSLTAENALKWNAIAPQRGIVDFSQAEGVAAFAKASHQQVYGHCLVWHEALPDWLDASLTPSAVGRLLQDHILSEVGKFKGRIAAWDVVNEAIERNDKRSDGLRNSVWLKTLGPGYIDLAFRWAHAADSKATLVFSDYGLEYDDETWMVEKRGTMLKYLEGLVRRQVPIGALGIQGHLIGERKPAYGAGLRRFLTDVASLGLQVFITELDVDDHKVGGSVTQRDAAVAAHYQAFLDCVLDEPAVKRVTTWGLSDRYSSKRDMMPRSDGQGVRPLPFDVDMVVKPAGRAMLKALTAAPRRT